jgi:Ca2+-binding RTX toxin-like protein
MGGRGNDRLSGSYGSARVYGEGGDDQLNGGHGVKDFLDGGAGNDWITGSEYDSMRGGAGNDTFLYDEQWHLQNPKEVEISGEAGRDTLVFAINEQSAYITGQTMEVHMSGESRGEFFMDSVPKGTFTGINEISAYDYFLKPVHLVYHGEDADTDMAVIGGNLGDQFYAGAGNETFTAGSGDDRFTFVFNEKGMGRDTIHNFGDSDIIGFTSSKDELRTTAVEHNGWTTYTSKYLDGTLAHVLNVDAVGLPPIQYDMIIG